MTAGVYTRPGVETFDDLWRLCENVRLLVKNGRLHDSELQWLTRRHQRWAFFEEILVGVVARLRQP